MRPTVFLALWCFSFLPAGRLPAADWAEKMFEITKHDFGRVPFGARAEYPFVVTNVNPFEVRIARCRVSCECTEPKISQKVLQPGEQATITAGLNTKKYNGRKGATITVSFSSPSYAEVQLHVTSFIDKSFELTPGSVELGTVDPARAAEREIKVRYLHHPGWRITGVRSENPFLSGEVTELSRSDESVEYRLKVRLAPNAPGGYLRDHLVLVTNDRQSSEVPVLVEGQILSEITVSPTVLSMGVVAPGGRTSKVFVVRGKRPFRILSVTCDAAGCTPDAVSAEDQPKSLYLIPVTFAAPRAPGKVSGAIRIRTDLRPEPFELPVRAVVSG